MTTDTNYKELEGRVAGFVSRLVAFSIDAVLIVIVIGLLTWVISQVEALFDTFLPGELDLVGVYVFAIPFIIAVYYVGLWALTGATVGKWLLGLRVVRADGFPPTIGHSVIRFIGYGLSAIVFFFGYIWVLFDEDRRAWHDDLAGTWVIYDFQRRQQGEVYSHRIEEG
jgi:uncharacterized RDD family membrane protein YckC